MRKRVRSIPLKILVVSVSRQSSMGLKAINLPHNGIEKPKRNFDYPRSSLCATSSIMMPFPSSFLLVRSSSRQLPTIPIDSRNARTKRSYSPIRQIPTPLIAFRVYFETSTSLLVLHLSLPLSPGFLSLLVSSSRSNFGDYINSKSILPTAFVPHRLYPTAVASLNYKNRFEYCSRSIRELMEAPLPI